MKDPDEQVVQMVTEILTSYQSESEKDLPIFISFMNDEGVNFAYLHCSYNDLRLIAATVEDEATLKMLAFNQDRLQKLIDEVDLDEEGVS